MHLYLLFQHPFDRCRCSLFPASFLVFYQWKYEQQADWNKTIRYTEFTTYRFGFESIHTKIDMNVWITELIWVKQFTFEYSLVFKRIWDNNVEIDDITISCYFLGMDFCELSQRHFMKMFLITNKLWIDIFSRRTEIACRGMYTQPYKHT